MGRGNGEVWAANGEGERKIERRREERMVRKKGFQENSGKACGRFMRKNGMEVERERVWC